MKDFIAISDVSFEGLRHLLDVSRELKKQYQSTGRNEQILAGKVLAMIFEKPSLRTRVSFEAGMAQLGGQGIYIRGEEVGLDVREPIADVARVLSGMCHGIMARTFEHAKITGLAKHASVPVINGLTDYNHPCQAMADVLTVEEHFGKLAGLTVAYIGDGNNVARSLAAACGKFGMRFVIAAPKGYELPREGMEFEETNDPVAAVKGADVLYTDTWVSMGQEGEKAKKLKEFAGFGIDEALVSKASKGAVVLHCLPAYRGYEISDGVMESERSLVFEQAANRMHFQKGLMGVLMGGR
ncbi:MAG TPA: ornithine carbamoyltransferase [Tepidisphaeraceae bacterium]|nr:ornithine carbamoyltransferase [Tepidisphaeraceae bacterium]